MKGVCLCKTRLKLSWEVNECKPLVRGTHGCQAGRGRCLPHRLHGRSVQVDPINPTLKPPGTKRLKLKWDTLLSSFAFKFNMRRYNVASRGGAPLQGGQGERRGGYEGG